MLLTIHVISSITVRGVGTNALNQKKGNFKLITIPDELDAWEHGFNQ